MDDLLNEFLTETNESLDVVDVELVKLEQDPRNKAVLDNIFRLVHTIKGTCGFLGLPRLEAVAHSAENVLGKFRDGVLDVQPQLVTLILQALDRIKEILAGLEATQEEPQGDDSALIALLDAAAENNLPPAEAIAEISDEAHADDAGAEDDSADQALGRPLKPGEVSLEELEAAFQSAPGPEMGDDGGKDAEDVFARLGGEDAMVVVSKLIENMMRADAELKPLVSDRKGDENRKRIGALLTALATDAGDDAIAAAVAALTNSQAFTEQQFGRFGAVVKDVLDQTGRDAAAVGQAIAMLEAAADICVRKAAKPVAASKPVPAPETDANDTAAKGGDGARASQSIRVNVDLLEDLMNLVSELVLTRNQLLQMVRRLDDSEFAVPLQRLSQCTTELQEGVMKTRMQPIGNAWAKLPRIVRDLSVELGKKIELDMRGADTELDRQVLELIKDPLTHMVRNSADHGIEIPADRLSAGKPETGTVRLNAYHEGGHIIIVVSDDGRGLNVERLRQKIIEKGLVSETEAEGLTEAQIQKYIFHPGLSTASQVTSVSGRGVSMDVVRSNIEKIGGTIELASTQGKGTTFFIKIPLTLAIVSALIVQANQERFAIPQISVLELVRTAKDTDQEIEHINNTPVLRLRNRLLPLVYLRDILGFQRADEQVDDFVIVTQVGAFTFGIVVDAVFDTEEIVVKPVAPILKEISIYSGNTILGDGNVIMILDPNGIANAVSDVMNESDAAQAETLASRGESTERESMLLFRAGSSGPKAVPLSLVARLEDIKVEDIEIADGRPMVQYRGSLMPLITVNDGVAMRSEGTQPVLVFTDGDRSMGLCVDEILDIVEENLDIELNSDTNGLIGTAVVAGKVTEIIDVAYHLKRAFSDWLSARKGPQTGKKFGATHGPRVLLIDDSAFFRNMLKPLLAAAGYRVTTVADAQAALKLRDDGVKFDLIVSDIEMPGLSGFDFAEQIKADGNWCDTPIVALSAMASEQDFERGRQVGFNDYVAKLDREALLNALSQQLALRSDAA
ncbi:MAG: chemotaxis protein CheW [Sphingomonadales bacterium]